MKRFLSLVLALLMLTGALSGLTLGASAAENGASEGLDSVHAYQATVNLDGLGGMNEPYLMVQTYLENGVRFGAAWDYDNLYVVIASAGANHIKNATISLGATRLWLAGNPNESTPSDLACVGVPGAKAVAVDKYIEVSIPLSEIYLNVNEKELSTPFSLSASTERGKDSFDGRLFITGRALFNKSVRYEGTGLGGKSGFTNPFAIKDGVSVGNAYSYNFGIAPMDYGYLFHDSVPGVKNARVGGSIARIGDHISSNLGGATHYSYYLNITDLPEVDKSIFPDSAGEFSNEFPYIMFLMAGRDGFITNSGAAAYIHNMKGKGLVLSIGLNNTSVCEYYLADYGIGLGDDFHFGINSNKNGYLDVFINDNYVDTIYSKTMRTHNVSNSGGYVIICEQRGAELKDGEFVQFTLQGWGFSVLNDIDVEKVLSLTKNRGAKTVNVTELQNSVMYLDGIYDEFYSKSINAGSLTTVKAGINSATHTLHLYFKTAGLSALNLKLGDAEVLVNIVDALAVFGKENNVKLAEVSGVEGAEGDTRDNSAYDMAEVAIPLSAINAEKLADGKGLIDYEITAVRSTAIGNHEPSTTANTVTGSFIYTMLDNEGSYVPEKAIVEDRFALLEVGSSAADDKPSQVDGVVTMKDGGAGTRNRIYATKRTEMLKVLEDRKLAFDVEIKALPEVALADVKPEQKSGTNGWNLNSTANAAPRIVFGATRPNAGTGLQSCFFSIFNTTEKGLVVACSIGAVDSNDMSVDIIDIEQVVGDAFSIATMWKADGSADLIINNEYVGTFENALASDGVGGMISSSAGVYHINYMRVRALAEGEAFEANISNAYVSDSAKVIVTGLGDLEAPIKLSYVQTSAVSDSAFSTRFVSTLNSLNFSETGYEIRKTDGTLLKKIESDKVYTSFINGGNTVTANEGEYFVILTEADLSAEEETTLVVRPYAVKNGKYYYGTSIAVDYSNGKVTGTSVHNFAYFVEKDENPFAGSELNLPDDEILALDGDQNSVIFDMGAVTDVNRVELTSISEEFRFANKNMFALYYSEDNAEYTYVKDFSILQSGNKLYFYNFDVDARYIKINCTENSDYAGDGVIINSVDNLITAYYTEKPLLAEDDFTFTTDVEVKNDKDVAAYNTVFEFTLDDLGIKASDLKSDKSDIRFSAKGAYLPHYYSNGVFYVRVFELEAGETAEIKVVYSSETAENVSSGDEVFEVQYGTKYAWNYNTPGWKHDVFEAPNGDILKICQIGKTLAVYRSTDGGMTFSPEAKPIPQSEGVVNSAGGVIVDNENDIIFCFGFYYVSDPVWTCEYFVFTSYDNGETWSDPVSPSNAPRYALSYSDGIMLSTADGDGPEVDYVFTSGVMRNPADVSFCSSAIYSKDGGKSWTFSDSRIVYDHGKSDFHEGGLSEEAVYELEDGTLVLFARCQIADILHFAVSYSTDKGVTWSQITDDTLSNIYTCNTQPILESFNGTPVFLWGGNNSIGGTSYKRFPLNLAPSFDDTKTFVDIVDASLQTVISQLVRLHTNPDVAFYEHNGMQFCYIVSTSHEMYIINADDYLYKTKGAFDSFEGGYHRDGWMVQRGNAHDSVVGATDGEKAMRVSTNTVVTRPIHYIEEGTVSFDYYISEFGAGSAIELQSAYNDCEGVTAPIRLVVDDKGNLGYYDVDGKSEKIVDLGIKMKKGNNSISIDFNGNEKTATVTVNGVTKDIAYIDGISNAICFVTLFVKVDADVSVDRFIANRKDK